MAKPPWVGPTMDAAIPGAGTHTKAAPNPATKRAKASTQTLGLTDIDPSPTTDNVTPIFIRRVGSLRVDRTDVNPVPMRYATRGTLLKKPANVYEPSISRSMAVSSTGNVKRPNPWATIEANPMRSSANQAPRAVLISFCVADVRLDLL